MRMYLGDRDEELRRIFMPLKRDEVIFVILGVASGAIALLAAVAFIWVAAWSV